MGFTFEGYKTEQPEESKSSGGFTFEGYSKPQKEKYEESLGKEIFRTGVQFPLGIAQKYSWPFDLLTTAEGAHGIQELQELQERLPELKKKFPNANWPDEIDAEKFLEANRHASEFNPISQFGIEGIIENATGLPLRPKNELQEDLRLAGMAGGLGSGSLLAKVGSSAAAFVIKKGLRNTNLPEGIQDIIALIVSGLRMNPKDALHYTKKLVDDFKKIGEKPPGSPPDFPPSAPPPPPGSSGSDGGGSGSPTSGVPPPPSIAPQLERQIPPPGAEGAPPFESNFDVGKSIKENLGLPKPEESSQNIYAAKILEPKERAKPLTPERVKVIGDELGLRPSQPKPKDLEGEIGNLFSPRRYYNTTEGGALIKREISALDEAAYENVNKLYAESREANAGIEDIHTQLVHDLLPRLERLEAIPSPSGPQNELIKSIKAIFNDIATISEGKITGYKPVNNQILIDQIQSLRQKIDYDFAHGDTRNIFKPVINDLQKSVRAAAERNNPEALEAFDKARTAYREWAEKFDNDYIRPFRDRSNKDFSKSFKGSLNPDEFNQISPILKMSENGKMLEAALKRELVNSKLEEFLKNPKKATGDAFNKALRELEAVISPQEANEVRRAIARDLGKSRIKAKEHVKPKAKEAKHPLEGKSEEQIAKMLDSISGIGELEKLLSGSKEGRQLLQELKDFKAADILYKGKLNAPDTSKSIVEILRDRESVAMLKRLLGNERFDKLKTVVDNAAKLEEFFDRLTQEIQSDPLNKLKSFFEPENLAKGALYGKKHMTYSLIKKLIDSGFVSKLYSMLRRLPKESIKDMPKERFDKLSASMAEYTKALESGGESLK